MDRARKPGRSSGTDSARSAPAIARSLRRSSGTGRSRTPERFRKLRRKDENVSGDRLLIATLQIRIPETFGIRRFSDAHPEVLIDILNRSDVSKDLSVSDYWISGRPPGVWSRELSGYPDVVSVDSLAELGDGCLYRITYRNPPIIYLYRELGLPIQFPLHVRGGFLHWEVVARRSESAIVLQYARTIDPNFRVVSIRSRPLKSHLPPLSDAQRQLLAQAMAAGYFAVPRAITLTELANKLDRSKSTLSEAIAIIERRLLESALRTTTMTP